MIPKLETGFSDKMMLEQKLAEQWQPAFRCRHVPPQTSKCEAHSRDQDGFMLIHERRSAFVNPKTTY
jgi:hypothetical protein